MYSFCILGLLLDIIFVSTGSIRWILWFSVRYTTAAAHRDFGVDALRGKLHQLGSPNLQDIFIGGGGGGGGGGWWWGGGGGGGGVRQT